MWLTISVSPLLFADAAGDAQQAANDINAAQNDAAANVPTTITAKNAEDRLDAAARNADDARAANDATQADPNATQEQRDAAQRAADDTQAAQDAAQERADVARGTSRDPDRAQRYREALERRREARARLRRAIAELRRALGNERQFGLNRDRERAIEDALNRARRALSTAESVVALSNKAGKGEAASVARDVARDAAKGVTRTSPPPSASAPAGGIISSNPARPACGGR